MDLIGRDHTVITLRPIGYAHPELLSLDGYDWVRVFGHVEEPTGSWSFEGESLLTSELQELSAWLHGVIDGSVPTSANWNEEHAAALKRAGKDLLYTESGGHIGGLYPGIGFTGEDLSLSLVRRSADSVNLAVSFSEVNQLPHEPMPHLNRRSESYLLPTSAADLKSAVDKWDLECSALVAQTSEEAAN